MSAKDCTTHKLKWGRIFPYGQLELTALTKETVKNQSRNFILPYFPLIDPKDFVQGGEKVLHNFYQLVFKQFLKECREKGNIPS